MHLDFLKAMVAFIGAGVASSITFLSDALPGDAETIVKSGGVVTTIGLLIYAVRHLNAEVRRWQDLREKDRERMEAQYDKLHEETQKSQESLAWAIRELRDTLKKPEA